jgi:hypothetical protein
VQAAAEIRLGMAYDVQCRYPEAARHHRLAAELSRESGWAGGQAVALNNLSRHHWMDGDVGTTIDLITEAFGAPSPSRTPRLRTARRGAQQDSKDHRSLLRDRGPVATLVEPAADPLRRSGTTCSPSPRRGADHECVQERVHRVP